MTNHHRTCSQQKNWHVLATSLGFIAATRSAYSLDFRHPFKTVSELQVGKLLAMTLTNVAHNNITHTDKLSKAERENISPSTSSFTFPLQAPTTRLL